MQWLLHALLPAQTLESHGHKTHLPAELGLPLGATPDDLLKAAGVKQCDVITTDGAVATAPFDRPTPFNRCIVYLRLSGDDPDLADAVSRLFARYARLSPGRLYTVTPTRVKVRQLPPVRSGL